MQAIGESATWLKPSRTRADESCMPATESETEAPEARDPKGRRSAGLPYWVTPHIDVRPQQDGSVVFFFGRSLKLGLAIALLVGATAIGLGVYVLRLGGHADVWGLVGIGMIGAIGGVSFGLLRSTGVIAQQGRLLVRTEWLPWLGSERVIPREDIEAIQRHVSLRLGGNSIYQVRAHLHSGEVVPVGHGISDKVEAASLASAMERALG